MAKCVIVSGTRICEDGPATYRVSGQRSSKPFAKLTKAQKVALRPVHQAIRALGATSGKEELLIALSEIVMAAKWSGNSTHNSPDIEGTVRLLLVSDLKKLDANFTLVAYQPP